MKYLISGAGGFLGGELVKQLSNRNGCSVIALSSNPEKLKEKFKASNNVEFLPKSIFEDREFSFNEIDVLINCAFPRNVDGIQLADGLSYISRLLNKASMDSVGSLINISSQSVYSQMRTVAADENFEVNLETKYAIAKYATELMTNTICKDIPHTNVRMASLIGPGFDQRIVNKFVKQILRGENLSITGGKQRFGFLDVQDAANGILEMNRGIKWKETYNLGIKGSYSLKQLADQVVECLGNSASVVLTENETWQNSELDTRVFEKDFGWTPDLSLEDSINRIIYFEKTVSNGSFYYKIKPFG